MWGRAWLVVCAVVLFFLMIRRPPRSTQSRSSAASDVYKRQPTPSSFSGAAFTPTLTNCRWSSVTRPARPTCRPSSSAWPRPSAAPPRGCSTTTRSCKSSKKRRPHKSWKRCRMTYCSDESRRAIEIAPDGRTAGRSSSWARSRSAQADLAAARPFAPNSFGGDLAAARPFAPNSFGGGR